MAAFGCDLRENGRCCRGAKLGLQAEEAFPSIGKRFHKIVQSDSPKRLIAGIREIFPCFGKRAFFVQQGKQRYAKIACIFIAHDEADFPVQIAFGN